MKKFIYYVLFFIAIESNRTIISHQVIIPMAGLGTRLLPLTKGVPKCMIPVIDKPALHAVVEEAILSQLTDFCFIVNAYEKETIEYYFSRDFELDNILQERNKQYLIEPLNSLISQTTFTYIPQNEPLGSGHAVLMGESFIEPNTSFSVMYPDDIIEGDDLHMTELRNLSEKYNASIITVEIITQEEASKYAVVTPKGFLEDGVFEVAHIVEKPQSVEQDLCFSQIGRFVFTYDIFESLKAIGPCADGEIQLTEAVRHMLQQGKRVIARILPNRRYDIGNMKSYLKTIVSLGLHHPLYKDIVWEVIEQERTKCTR